jgi:hypothetical protein
MIFWLTGGVRSETQGVSISFLLNMEKLAARCAVWKTHAASSPDSYFTHVRQVFSLNRKEEKTRQLHAWTTYSLLTNCIVSVPLGPDRPFLFVPVFSFKETPVSVPRAGSRRGGRTDNCYVQRTHLACCTGTSGSWRWLYLSEFRRPWRKHYWELQTKQCKPAAPLRTSTYVWKYKPCIERITPQVVGNNYPRKWSQPGPVHDFALDDPNLLGSGLLPPYAYNKYASQWSPCLTEI